VNPFDDPRREESETLAAQAERAWSEGRRQEAQGLFAKAAKIEEDVALGVLASVPRSRSVLARSAVALWYKAGEYEHAKRIAYSFLATEALTEQGRSELEDLVDRCSREGAVASARVASDMIPVEMKMDGGRVLVGLAPASAARMVRERAMQLLMRSADYLSDQDYREQGPSELQRRDRLQIYEAPARAASFGVRLYVATGTQPPLVTSGGGSATGDVTPVQVVDYFLQVAGAASSSPAAIRDIVKKKEYADAFIEGFGDIAPDGEEVARVTCSAPSWRLPNAPRASFERPQRDALRAAVGPKARLPRPGEKDYEGKLIEVRLNHSEQWLQLEVEGQSEPVCVMLPSKDKKLMGKAASFYMQRVRLAAYMPSGRNKRITLASIDAL
jgi:hypothetical protein